MIVYKELIVKPESDICQEFWINMSDLFSYFIFNHKYMFIYRLYLTPASAANQSTLISMQGVPEI